jgi:ribonuclease-3
MMARAAVPAPPAAELVDADPELLADRLGHRFRDRRLLRDALRHPSVVATSHATPYERLEFLGDRVLGLVIAELLMRRFPTEPEGHLARRLAAHVRREALAEVAQSIDLGRHLMLSRGEEVGGGRTNAGTLADCMEAVIGALYVDGGLPVAARFIHERWEERVGQRQPPRDPKTALQEWAQGRGLPLPRYETVSAEGPDHAPAFTVSVSIEGHPGASAVGASKRAAERAAAEALLDALLAGGRT